MGTHATGSDSDVQMGIDVVPKAPIGKAGVDAEVEIDINAPPPEGAVIAEANVGGVLQDDSHVVIDKMEVVGDHNAIAIDQMAVIGEGPGMKIKGGTPKTTPTDDMTSARVDEYGDVPDEMNKVKVDEEMEEQMIIPEKFEDRRPEVTIPWGLLAAGAILMFPIGGGLGIFACMAQLNSLRLVPFTKKMEGPLETIISTDEDRLAFKVMIKEMKAYLKEHPLSEEDAQDPEKLAAIASEIMERVATAIDTKEATDRDGDKVPLHDLLQDKKITGAIREMLGDNQEAAEQFEKILAGEKQEEFNPDYGDFSKKGLIGIMVHEIQEQKGFADVVKKKQEEAKKEHDGQAI